MAKRRYLEISAALLSIALVAIWWADRTPDETPRLAIHSPDDAEQFVGSQRCATCHPQISESYRSHPMSRSAGAVTHMPGGRSQTQLSDSGAISSPQAQSTDDALSSTAVAQDSPNAARDAESHSVLAEFSTGPFAYVVERFGEKYVHREELRSDDGELLTERALPVHFEIGSGERGKSYLTNDRGLLVESPLTWYSHEQKWALSPGYKPDKIDRFERRIGRACLSCHVGRLTAVDTEQTDRFNARKPFHEPGIGCERCHGPGLQHASLHENGHVLNGQDSLIVNPARLQQPLRDAICYQCHLTSKRILRHGHDEFDFRPGNGLESVWTIFVPESAENADDIDRAVSHVGQMWASRCFTGSNEQLSCLSCHDPHSVPSAETKAAFYRERCQACHDESNDCGLPLQQRENAPTFNSCIDCHMPTSETADIAHLTQSDHRIPRIAQPADESVHAHASNVELKMFAGPDSQVPDWEITRGHGLALYREFIESPDPKLLDQVVAKLQKSLETMPDDVAVRRALAAVYQIRQNPAEARVQLEEVFRLSPGDDDALTLLGVVCYRTGDFQAALDFFEKSLGLNPWQAETYGRCAAIHSAFGDFDAAVSTLEQAIILNPTHVQLRTLLVEALSKQGNTTEAENQERLLEQIRRRLQDAGL